MRMKKMMEDEDDLDLDTSSYSMTDRMSSANESMISIGWTRNSYSGPIHSIIMWRAFHNSFSLRGERKRLNRQQQTNNVSADEIKITIFDFCFVEHI